MGKREPLVDTIRAYPSSEFFERCREPGEVLARRARGQVDEGLPFAHDARSLAMSSVWNLICPFGEFDISFMPSGIAGGYDELAVRAHRVRVDAVDVMVADLSDVIRSKEAAGRPKDLQVLPILYRFDRQRRESDPSPRDG